MSSTTDCAPTDSSSTLPRVPRTSTRFARSLSPGVDPYALTRLATFFLASGRHIARMTGLPGDRRNRLMASHTAGSGAACMRSAMELETDPSRRIIMPSFRTDPSSLPVPPFPSDASPPPAPFSVAAAPSACPPSASNSRPPTPGGITFIRAIERPYLVLAAVLRSTDARRGA